jgi:hypothetical protein
MLSSSAAVVVAVVVAVVGGRALMLTAIKRPVPSEVVEDSVSVMVDESCDVSATKVSSITSTVVLSRNPPLARVKKNSILEKKESRQV